MPLLLAAALLAPADDPPDRRKMVEEATGLIEAGKYREAADLAETAIRLDPKYASGHHVAGTAYLHLRENEKAVKAFTAALELDPEYAAAYDRRGDAYLKSGKFKDAVADFDKFLEMKPKFAADHWRRGIALYYAGQFADGVKQFDLHRTVNPEDVENSAWHYLCNARATSPKQARKDLIPVNKDARVPMREVLKLFAGELKPADVLAAAEAAPLKGERKTEARFYAHLYVGLYYEAEGDAAKAKEHIKTAAEKYKIGHYMWDVADAHLGTFKK